MLSIIELRESTLLSQTDWYHRRQFLLTKDSPNAGQAVATIIADVQKEKDAAVVRYMRKWTDPHFDPSRIRVQPEELTRALESLNPSLRVCFEGVIRNVRAYQQHILPRDPDPVQIDGAELGLRFTPVDTVGLAVPGGKAAYPSTVIMLAVPAIVAGVSPDHLSVICPPPTASTQGESHGDISSLVLAVCELIGIKRVYRIGGAQGIAALALGTETVAPVDMIVGPGNVYTQLAKLQLSGAVGIDGFYGPSEILTLADRSANPARIASDLLAQAEHDPGSCILVAWERGVIDQINRQIQERLKSCSRRQAIEKSLNAWSIALLVQDEGAAANVVDQIAAEHVNLAVADPNALLRRVRHGGEFFLGDASPVAAGDYWAGPSHCLPTATTARYASGVSVYTFLKRSGTVCYRKGMPQHAIDSIARLAQAEGLDAHAASAQSRLPS
jgi:histidinol dehydrogenase